ncbi:MAG: type II toxin-antitoxin system RelE/ParE family toxin [Verrucomicrobiae bacterium]|nr:type II toxin-antitoxin system RelE/ParE family toxin [Verrucomicrobiae bacterium]
MSVLTYLLPDYTFKPIRWLHGEIKTPPMSTAARREMGMLLRELQEGEMPAMPHSRPMSCIGIHCHELRVNDENKTWRLIYRIDPDAIVILEVFEKKTRQTPRAMIENCRRRIKFYEASKP